MNTAIRTSPNEADSPYLHCLQALTEEIEGAIGAIASDDLLRFAESVHRQEALASTLVSLRSALRNTAALITPNSSVRSAERELRLANLQYAALLKHFTKTIGTLLALCGSYAGETVGRIPGQSEGHRRETRGTRSKHQTWSCEM